MNAPIPTETPRIAHGGVLHHLRVSIVATIILSVICCGIYPLIVWGLSQAFFHDKANGSLITDDKGQVIGSKLIGQPFADTRYFHPRPSAAGSGYDPTASGGSNLGPTSKKLINGTTKPTTQPNPKGGDPIAGPDAVDYDGIKLRVVEYLDENNRPYELAREKRDEHGKVIERTVIDPKTFKTDKGDYDQVKLVNAFNSDEALTVKPGIAIPADAVTASASGLDPHISVENALIQVARVATARSISEDKVKQLLAANTDGRNLGILGEPGVNVLLLNLALDKEYPAAPPTTQPASKP